MSLFNWLGEFFLFRRLFGSHHHSNNSNSSDAPLNNDMMDDIAADNEWNGFADYSDDVNRSYEDFLDEQDNYDMMDDVIDDIF